MTIDSQATRNPVLDWLRTVAILAVLVIHSAARYAITPTEYRIGTWLTLVSRPTIALFLFISGVLFAGANPTMRILLRRWYRVVVPYLVFSTLALYYTYRAELIAEFWQHPQQMLADIVLGNTFGIYYFVFVIVCMYGLGYLIEKLQLMQIHGSLLVMTALICNIVHVTYGLTLWRYIGFHDDTFGLYADRSPLVWGVFFVLGLWYQHHDGQRFVRDWCWLLRILWVSVFALYSIFYFAGVSLSAIDGYHSLMGTVYSLATIGALLTFSIRNNIIFFLSSISYYLYLVHIFFVYGFLNIILQSGVRPNPLVSLASFVISLVGPIALYIAIKRLLPRDTRLLLGA